MDDVRRVVLHERSVIDFDPSETQPAKDPRADAAESARHEEALGHDATLTDSPGAECANRFDKDRMFVPK